MMLELLRLGLTEYAFPHLFPSSESKMSNSSAWLPSSHAISSPPNSLLPLKSRVMLCLPALLLCQQDSADPSAASSGLCPLAEEEALTAGSGQRSVSGGRGSNFRSSSHRVPFPPTKEATVNSILSTRFISRSSVGPQAKVICLFFMRILVHSRGKS